MKRWMIHGILFAALVPLGAACDGGATTESTPGVAQGGTGTVRGHLDVDGGMQHTGGGAAMSAIAAESVAVVTVGDGATVVGTAAIGADGAFVVEGLPAIDGAFMVQALDASGAVVGQVIVTGSLADGGEAVVLPISAETTAEAQAWTDLGAEADPVALSMIFTAEMAISADASTTAALGDALEAWQQAYGSISATARATALAEARAQAWGELAIALDAATTAEQEHQAWGAFEARVTTAIAAATDVNAGGQAAAAEAAAFALNAKASGAASQSAAAALVAEAHKQAELDAASTLDASGTISGDVSAAYDAFFVALAGAGDAAAIAEAQAHLSEALGASGSASSSTGSALGGALMLTGDYGTQVDAIAHAVATAHTTLDASLGATSTPTEIGDAFAGYYAELQTATTAAVSAGADQALASFAASASSQAAAAGTITLPELPVELPEVAGLIDTTDEVVSEARALVEGLVTGLGDAVSAQIVAIAADGSLSIIGAGEADGATWSVAMDEAATAQMAMVELLDADGVIVGAASIAGGVSEGTFAPPTVTTETTAQAKVLLATLISGAAPADIDMELLASLISGATAKAIVAEDGAAAASVALEVAAQVKAQTSAATAMATAEVAAAFEAMIGSMASGSTLLAAVDAETQLANAGAAMASFQAMDASVASSALDALAAATSQATTGADIVAAGETFEAAIMASLHAELLAGLALPGTEAALDEALAGLGDAKAALAASIQATAVGAGDAQAKATAIVQAFAMLQADVDAVFAAELLSGADQASLGAVAQAALLLDAGMYGTPLN